MTLFLSEYNEQVLACVLGLLSILVLLYLLVKCAGGDDDSADR